MEVNATYDLPVGCALLLGYRAFSLDEMLSMTFAAAVLPSIMDVTSDNSMSALQVGCKIRPVHLTDAIYMSGNFKIGWGSNRITSDTILDTGVVIVSAAGSDDRSMSFIEFGFGAQYAISENITAGLSYQYLQLYGVALAVHQMPAVKLMRKLD